MLRPDDGRVASVATCPPTHLGTIEPILTLDSPDDGRSHRLRRLGVLAATMLLTLAVVLVLGGEDDGTVPVAAAGETTDTVGDGEVVAESSSAPVTLAQVYAETASTLLEATTTTVAESTTTTAVPDTTTTAAPATVAPTTAAPTSTAPKPERTVAKSSSSTSPPATSAPTTTTTTTAPPPPTTAAPSTTSAPPQESGSGDGSYSDPNTLQVWLDLADCEAGGNWQINTGNGYYGGLQFSLGSWERVGGTGYPHEASRDTQIEMGRRLQARSGWGAWPHCSKKLGLR